MLRALGVWDDEQLAKIEAQRKKDKNAWKKTTAGMASKKRHHAKRSRTQTGSFLGWDGEGITVNGRHRYILLANGKGETLVNTDGLTTQECLEFLSGAGQRHSFTNHVMYGGNYDANMILGDLSWRQMARLASRGELEWRGWLIQYRHRKYLEVSKITRRKDKRVRLNTIKIWDVIDFFNTKFVTACKEWLPGRDVSWIAEMKEERAGFRVEELSTITTYCIEECILLGLMMEELRKQCLSVDICPQGWYGPGALATRALQLHKVGQYRDEQLANGFPPEIALAARHAFFGGRIEMVQFGHHVGPVYAHDIVSAYPSVMGELPCLAHGEWEWIKRPWINHGEISSFSLVKIEHKPPPDIRGIHPLPWRADNGGVLFPPAATGWYWLPEALLVPMNEWLEVWSFYPGCDHKPFDWVPVLFDKRRAMKANGHPAERVLKLCLNSLYGKMAQRVGRGDKSPPFHQIEWAGYVTSTVRSRMYNLATRDPSVVIAFETDGIYCTGDLCGSDTGTALGDFEVKEYDEIAYVHSGIYFLRKGDRWISRYRGLDPPRINQDGKQIGITPQMVMSAWQDGTRKLPASSSRFRGLATSSLTPERYHEWGQWITEPRDVDLYPTGKRAWDPGPTTGHGPADALQRTIAVGSGLAMSTAHKVAWIDGPSAHGWADEELSWEDGET
jgi:hypothetical protein